MTRFETPKAGPENGAGRIYRLQSITDCIGKTLT
jgi:hypothetical protein